ncbi:MAG: hypothetical protein DHS20C18_38670 [Saprospiraceae bacterium]|nr:MAG: hypothetical protein DHS20C18_38670 [Saprospiraceae bacterium]
MKYLSYVQATLALLLITFTFACGGEQEQKNEELLLGKWELQKASRNGRVTESLTDLYFEFFQDGKMRTNISGLPESVSYEVDGNTIHQREGQLEADYAIESLSDTLLILMTKINDYNFNFVLTKVIQEE